MPCCAGLCSAVYVLGILKFSVGNRANMDDAQKFAQLFQCGRTSSLLALKSFLVLATVCPLADWCSGGSASGRVENEMETMNEKNIGKKKKMLVGCSEPDVS